MGLRKKRSKVEDTKPMEEPELETHGEDEDDDYYDYDDYWHDDEYEEGYDSFEDSEKEEFVAPKEYNPDDYIGLDNYGEF